MSNMRKKILSFCVSLTLVSGIVSTAAAANVPWGDNAAAFPATGANARFGWSGGENTTTDHFGDPTVTEAGFFFNNTDNFRAQVDAPQVTTVTDIARVTVNVADATPAAAPGFPTIIIREFGTFAGNPADFNATISFDIFRFAPVVPPFSFPGTTGSLLLPDITFDIPNGTWFTERTLNVGDPLTSPSAGFLWNVAPEAFQITVTNTLQISGSAAPGSFFQKDGMAIIVPEPGTALLLVLAGPLLLLRRRFRR